MSRVVVGRIVKPFGVRGEVVIDATGEDPGRFARGVRLYGDGAPAELDGVLEVRLARHRGGSIVVAFEGIEDRDAAEELVGTVLSQEEERLPELPAGQYYHFQLVGLAVVRDDGTAMGEVIRVHELPAGDVLEVRGPGHEWMLPRHGELELAIDLAAHRIVVTASDDFLAAVGQVRTEHESPGRIRQRARQEARKKAWEAREARRREAAQAAEKEAAERAAAELDPETWNRGGALPPHPTGSRVTRSAETRSRPRRARRPGS